MSSNTTIAHAELARRNEELVLAEATLQGQRFIGGLRIVAVLAMGLSMQLMVRLTQVTTHRDSLRVLAISSYLIFSVATFVYYLRRKKPAERRRMVASQVLRSFADFGFQLFMAWRTAEVDHANYPEMTAASCAIFLGFTVASYHWINVAVATAMACLTYLIAGSFAQGQSMFSLFFVEAMLLCMGLAMGLTGRHVGRMFVNLRRRDNLTRFLSPQVAEHAMSLGSTALAPVQREVTLLFSDIRDFTSLSESATPREVLELLDDYFGHMGQIVKGRDGIVNKFIGDGLLAVWNVPNHDERHVEHAVRAALDMRRKLTEINAHRATLGKAPLRIGIGIHTGLVAAGMLGGADQHEYTVIGDAVNVASRIEGLNKHLGTDILVSEVSFRLVEARFACRRVGEEKVKGREQPVVIYEVQGEASASADARSSPPVPAPT
jgi:adenylate cyclase